MTCPFYVAGRPSCLLGEPDGRHCGPRQYPAGPCNLDLVGEWGAWRAFIDRMTHPDCPEFPYTFALVYQQPKTEVMPVWWEMDAVGWSP